MGLNLLVIWGSKNRLLGAPSSPLSQYGKKFKDRDLLEAKIPKALLDRERDGWLFFFFFPFSETAEHHNS